MLTIKAWLEQLGLARYAAIFEANDIDIDILSALTDEELLRLGVSLGDRKRMQRALAGGIPSQPIGRDVSHPYSSESRSTIESATAEGERRQLTVLFCDLVASTTLAERRDPEEYRQLLACYHQTCVQAIQRFEGYVAQLQGDGVLAYYGYPLAHEGEADRALRSALDIVDGIAQLDNGLDRLLRVRIGVATGMVVVSHILAADKHAVGETPNLAARLQTLAKAGEVVICDRTKALVRGAFDFEDRGLHELKGFSTQQRIWRTLGSSAAPSRFDAATGGHVTPLVGREVEMLLLQDRWNRAIAGEGQAVLLSGEPGIGKSRLLRAAKPRSSDAERPNLFQCSPYHRHSTFFPFVDHLSRRYELERSDSPERKLDKLESGLPNNWRHNVLAVHLLARMLAIPCEARYGRLAMSAQREKDEVQSMLVQLVAEQGEASGSLVLFEDVHWIDATSLEVLDTLLRRLVRLPLLVLITYRPEFRSSWGRLSHITELAIDRLPQSQAPDVITHVAGGKSFPPDLTTRIVEKADGVPLFLEELTKAVLESDLLQDQGEQYQYSAPASETNIPATLYDSLMARLDRLIPIKEVAQLGAVVGRQFSHELLRLLSPMPEEQLVAALEKLVAAEIVLPLDSMSGRQFVFKHALLQDAAYASLLKSKRLLLHREVAQCLTEHFPAIVSDVPEVLGHHFTEAECYALAVPHWIRAGDRAIARTALADAVAHLTKALQVNDQTPTSDEKKALELRIRMLLGTAYLTFKGHASREVLQTLEPARDIAIELGDDERLVPILFYLWMYHTAKLDFDAGLRLVGQLDRLAERTRNSYAFVVARNAENMTHGWTGNFQRAWAAAERGVRAYEPERHSNYVHIYNHDQKCGILVWAVHFLWTLGYPDQAQRAAQEMVDLARRLGHPFNLAFSLTVGCVALVNRGETELAQRWIAEADFIARENAIGYMTGFFVPFWTGIVQVTDGQYAEGYSNVSAAWTFFAAGGGGLLAPLAAVIRARALIGMARFVEARNLLHDALIFIEKTNHRMHEAEVHRLMGELHSHGAERDTTQAIAHLEKALQVARSQEAKGWELRAATALAKVLFEEGQRREAFELLAPIQAWFKEGLDTRDLKDAAALLALLL